MSWLAIALFLVWTALLLVAWTISRLTKAVEDAHDWFADNLAWDDFGRPVIATTEAEWRNE